MSEVRISRRDPHRVRQGWRPPHPPGRQGARRALRPRHDPVHSRCPAREFAAAIRHGGTNAAADHRARRRRTQLALPKAIQRDPIKRHLRARRPAARPPRREGHGRGPGPRSIGEAARDTLVDHRAHHALRRGRRHQACPSSSRSPSRACEAGSHDHRRRRQLPAGSSWPPTPTLIIAVVAERARPPRQLEAAEAGRGGETAEAAEGREAPPSRAERRAGSTEVAAAEPHATVRCRGASAGDRTTGALARRRAGQPRARSTRGNRHNVGFMVARPARRAGRRQVQPAQGSRADVRRGPAGRRAARRAGQAATVHERVGRPGRRRSPDSTRCRSSARRRARRARHPLRRRAAQARRRRGRPQRAALDHRVARHAGLPAGALRHRPPAGPHGPGRLRARDFSPASARSSTSSSTAPPTRSRC